VRVHHAPIREPDPAVTPNLHRAAANWAANRERAVHSVDWPAWRARATAIREDAIRHLPELLDAFAERVTAAGGTVHRAATADDARRIVVRLCAERGLTRAVKGKSMLTEELGLTEALAGAGVEAVETDLGEYIVQLLGERPSHILAPAVHVSAAQVAELFGVDADDPQAMLTHARRALRRAFLEGDVGITGVNFGVAETGTLLLVESEGNLRMVSSLPRVHVALMGIEKIVRDWAGAAHLVQMLPLAAHGRPAATYTSAITGVGDGGPEELHVVLVDDGRSDLVGTDLESALHCIRCGACLYVCPVYRQTGGHHYGSAYTGPIGAVLTPALERSAPPSDELPWMSSLCGACTDACPVGIPLDEHLVTLRAQARHPDGERAFWEAWARLWSRPSTYRATAATAGKVLKPLWRAAGGWTRSVPGPFAGWTDERDARAPAVEPFHARWKRVRGGR
jgi:L-lactate dehydrogenase complex protein LldF